MKVVIDIPKIPTNDKQRWALSHGTPYEERPHGEWKPRQMLVGGNGAVFMHDGFECECGRVVTQKENFCPNCGADMRRGETE